MVLLINEGIVGDARNFAANTLGGSDGQVEVLLDLINIDVLLHVDSSHVDGVFLDQVDQLAKNNTVRKHEEEVIVVDLHWQVVRNICITFQMMVEGSCEDFFLFNKV